MANPLLMGIVNATPDSFYDGDPQNNLASLLAKCKDYVQSGADMLDIGGESTRPNATPVSAEEEISRVLPLIRAVIGMLAPVLPHRSFRVAGSIPAGSAFTR